MNTKINLRIWTIFLLSIVFFSCTKKDPENKPLPPSEFDLLGTWNCVAFTSVDEREDFFVREEISNTTCRNSESNYNQEIILKYKYVTEYLKFIIDYVGVEQYRWVQKGTHYLDTVDYNTCEVARQVKTDFSMDEEYDYKRLGDEISFQLPESTGPYWSPAKLTVISSTKMKLHFTEDEFILIFEKEK